MTKDRNLTQLRPIAIVHHPVTLHVAGSLSQEKHITATLRQFAVYIANLFFLTSDAWAPVVPDTELDEEMADQYNLILVGSPLENSWVEQYHGKVPLKYRNKSLALGKLC